MKVSMVDMNKKANQIVRQVIQSGEVATVFKHGRPVAEIRPLACDEERQRSLDYLCSVEPVKVSVSPEELLAGARKRGV